MGSWITVSVPLTPYCPRGAGLTWHTGLLCQITFIGLRVLTLWICVVHDDRHGNFRPFRDCWFPIGMLDAAAFHQILSNSALHLGSLKTEGTPETLESIKYHSEAVKSVQERIADPIRGITDGIIVTIIAFACHDVGFCSDLYFYALANRACQHLIENFNRWTVHMQGLPLYTLLLLWSLRSLLTNHFQCRCYRILRPRH